MNCIIVDDQPIFRAILKTMVLLDPSLILIAECADAIEAHQKILQHQIDIIFLDIEMPGMSGMEMAKILAGKSPLIIFVTSRPEYAVEAFDLNVVDFIVKPIVTARFLKAVEKAKEVFKTKDLTIDSKAVDFAFIRDSNLIKRIKVSDILYLEASGDYVKIYFPDKTFTIHSSLKSVELRLPQNIFLRVHRSFIINLSKLDTIEGGTLIINKMMIPVSDSYRANLNQSLQIL